MIIKRFSKGSIIVNADVSIPQGSSLSELYSNIQSNLVKNKVEGLTLLSFQSTLINTPKSLSTSNFDIGLILSISILLVLLILVILFILILKAKENNKEDLLDHSSEKSIKKTDKEQGI